MVPSAAFSDNLAMIKPYIRRDCLFVWGAKGFVKQDNSLRFLHEQVAYHLGNIACAVLSGPTFAIEVARNLPTATVVASTDKSIATQLQLLLHSDRFRVYTSTDIVGVQMCGGIKNVLAVAAGIADGMGLGEYPKAH